MMYTVQTVDAYHKIKIIQIEMKENGHGHGYKHCSMKMPIVMVQSANFTVRTEMINMTSQLYSPVRFSSVPKRRQLNGMLIFI